MSKSFDDEDWKTDDDSNGDWGSESEEQEENSDETESSEEEEEEEEESSAGNEEDYSDEDEDIEEDVNDDDDPKYAEDAEQYPYPDEEPAEGGGEDETQNIDEAREKSRRALLACFLCCLCLLVISGAVVLGILLTDGNGDSGGHDNGTRPTSTKSPIPAPQAPVPTVVYPALPSFVLTTRPTDSPTISPLPTMTFTTSPTGQPTPAPSTNPTMSPAPTEPVPDELVIPPDEDTFIYVDGFTNAESYGKDDTLLVQHGLKSDNRIPNAFILITFDLESIPLPWRITDRENHAILRLTHLPRTSTGSPDPQTYTISRLPTTPLAVETLHGLLFVPFEPIPGPTFTVNPGTRRVEVDITSLLFDQPPFVDPDDTNTTRRHSRGLQGPGTQLFLMIDAQGPEQPLGGDRFHSRESDFSPDLYVGFFQPGAPLPTKAPSLSPTVSPAPTISLLPSFSPSLRPPSGAPNLAEGMNVRRLRL